MISKIQIPYLIVLKNGKYSSFNNMFVNYILLLQLYSLCLYQQILAHALQ